MMWDRGMPAELCLPLKQSDLQASAPKCPIGNHHQGGQNHVKIFCVCVYICLVLLTIQLESSLAICQTEQTHAGHNLSWNARSNAVPSKKAWPMLTC